MLPNRPCDVKHKNTINANISILYGEPDFLPMHHPWNSNCYENSDPMPEESEPSLAGRLAGAGYRTHAIGK